MQTHNLGYPRIGSQRELKKASEQYWAEKISTLELLNVGAKLRKENWLLQQQAGIDLIPSNDFSFYDQVLDMSLTVGAIPERYQQLRETNGSILDLYFAMARGYQKNGLDITAMEMTKWFNTNYHFIVPEFYKNQEFSLFSTKIIDEFNEAKELGILTKPVLLGPVSYLLLGKEKEEGFNRIELLNKLIPVYISVLKALEEAGATHIQFDEPFLCLDIDDTVKSAYQKAYNLIREVFPQLNIQVATYFESVTDNASTALFSPVNTLHIDLISAPEQLDTILSQIPDTLSLSLGIVDGRNIWKNNYEQSLQIINQVVTKIGAERVLIAPSCSLLHVPCDLDLETTLDTEIKQWLAFAKQKINEVAILKQLALQPSLNKNKELLSNNVKAIQSKTTSTIINNSVVKNRVAAIKETHTKRLNTFATRKQQQEEVLKLPLFPTTTIGSFPQTKTVRSWRAKYKQGALSATEYQHLLEEETEKAIRWQEKIGLDVLVHGEFERNDMVEYFGEQLSGFTFTKFGWVQSYGSRCVKPPIIYGDVSRPLAMTVDWAVYAQSLTSKYVKGMLTGPVTILQWSFVRNDQPRFVTCNQIALAIRDEVTDLEKAGIKIIQIDEPAIREGLPLKKNKWENYLNWAVNAFKIASCGVEDSTQIHTHMCYSEFNDIIQSIANMDADVITIECSRSQMELLDAFAEFKYPNEIGPGVYDIHSPRVPTKEEIVALLDKAINVLPADKIWVNPDCGLKTRNWDETEKALEVMVNAAKELQLLHEQTTA